MKSFIVLLISIYMTMATMSAPLLHLDNKLQMHDPSDATAMNMEFRDTNAPASGISDMISRCLRAAAFFTTAVPSSPLVLAILAVLLLLCGFLLCFWTRIFNTIDHWKFVEVHRRNFDTIHYLAQRLFREWLALFELSPSFIAASSG